MGAGLAMLPEDKLPEQVGQHVSQAVRKTVWHAWFTLAASLLVVAGTGLLFVGLFLLIEPQFGSAAAFTVIGLIALALGGGLFLYLRHR